MNRSSNFITLLCLIIVGCAPPAENSFEVASQNIYNLKGEKTYFPELIMPIHLNVVGEYLIVSEGSRIPPELPLLHVIKKDPLTYQYPKGVTGFGPFEISDASSLEPGLSDSTFTVYSAINKKIVDFSFNDTSRLGIREYKQPDELFGIYRMFHATDTTIIGIMANDKNRLVEYSLKDGKRLAGYGTWGKIPDTDHLIDYTDPDINYHMGEINTGRFKANRKLEIFVKASVYRDRIEIFNYKTKTFNIVDGPRLEVPNFKVLHRGGESAVVFNRDHPYGHGEIAIGEKYIYISYAGVNEKQIKETGEIAKTIYMLKHSGEIVGMLNLDFSIRDLGVDEKLGKIYGLTTDEDPGIVVFEIPEPFLN
jgi:hypothetical protein